MRASLGTILDFYPPSSNLELRFDKTSSLSFRSWGRRALASDQSQAIKLVNISRLLHFWNTIQCSSPSLTGSQLQGSSCSWMGTWLFVMFSSILASLATLLLWLETFLIKFGILVYPIFTVCLFSTECNLWPLGMVLSRICKNCLPIFVLTLLSNGGTK